MYELRQPAADLAPWIENYWSVRGSLTDRVDVRVDVFVDARADLIFNLGAPYRRETIGGPATTVAASNFDAQRMVPIRIVQRGAVDTVGVRFRLGGVGPFVAGPLRDVTGQTPAASAVFGAAAGRLESALRAASDVEARALVLDAFFRARIREHGPAASFEAALRVLVESDGGASVASVAAAAGVSVRQVERLFARHLGIPPKAVGRVLRFQRALRSLMREPSGTLAEVALDAGYFDQAHFIRDFRAMTGGVPRGYRGYYPPDGPRDFAPNVVVFVQDEA